MSWKCVCKEENNPDESQKCKNCGRNKPKYLGVKLDLGATEKMTPEQLAAWYLMIAQDHLSESDEYLNLYAEYRKKLGDQNYNQVAIQREIDNCKSKIDFNCKQCLSVLEKSISLSQNAQFEDQNGTIYTTSSVKSDCYFNLGSLQFKQANYAEAIKYYQSSYDADPNQVSIYNIAMATINLPVEGGGIFGGKKKQAAEETKREQEIDLLNKTIKFAPFSTLGIKSGRIQIKDYNIKDFDI